VIWFVSLSVCLTLSICNSVSFSLLRAQDRCRVRVALFLSYCISVTHTPHTRFQCFFWSQRVIIIGESGTVVKFCLFQFESQFCRAVLCVTVQLTRIEFFWKSLMTFHIFPGIFSVYPFKYWFSARIQEYKTSLSRNGNTLSWSLSMHFSKKVVTPHALRGFLRRTACQWMFDWMIQI